MPTPTFIAMAKIELPSDVNSVMFYNIPTTYRDLVLSCSRHANNPVTEILYLNAYFSGSGYNRQRMWSEAANKNADAGSSIETVPLMSGADRTHTVYQFIDANQSNKTKAYLYRSGSNLESYTAVGRVDRSEAINRIQLKAGGSNLFRAGSTFQLFGIEG